MGFQIPKRTVTVTFEDGDFVGAEARMQLDPPMGEFLRVINALNAGRFEELCDLVASMLISWTVDDAEGKPLAPTKEGVLGAPMSFVIALANEWAAAQTGPSGPLGKPSSNGAEQPPSAIPMVVLGSPGQ